jgi:hypothetical protein
VKNPNTGTQEDLEILFSKYQLLPVLREQFSTIVPETIMVDLNIEPAMATEVLVQIYLHRQADPATMVGILSPKFGEPQFVADKLYLLVLHDYVDYDEDQEKFMVKFDISDDVKAMVDLYQYPLPMVIKPYKVESNFDSGYKTINTSVVLNGSNYFNDKDMCLDHLNRANSVALALNFDAVKSAEGKFQKPVRAIGEDFDDFQKRVRQANTFYGTSLEAMAHLDDLTDTIYLTHKYDRRGRVYASGYHINTQGDDYRKAVIELAHKEIIHG